LLFYEIVNCCTKTIAMYRVYGLEKLVPVCTLPDDSDIFSIYEKGTTSITPKVRFDDQTMVTAEKKAENQKCPG